jgi:hypothetical protein
MGIEPAGSSSRPALHSAILPLLFVCRVEEIMTVRDPCELAMTPDYCRRSTKSKGRKMPEADRVKKNSRRIKRLELW